MNWDVKITKRVSKQMKRILKKEALNILDAIGGMMRKTVIAIINELKEEEKMFGDDGLVIIAFCTRCFLVKNCCCNGCSKKNNYDLSS